MTARLDGRVITELYRLHSPSRTYQGLTAAGEAHLAAGGFVGSAPAGMSMGEAFNAYVTCRACKSPKDLTGAYPCETIRLLIEAGAIPSVDDHVIAAMLDAPA